MPELTQAEITAQAQEIVRRVARAMHDPELVVKNPENAYEGIGQCRACVWGHVWKRAGILTPLGYAAEALVDDVAWSFTSGKIDRETAAARLDEIVAGF